VSYKTFFWTSVLGILPGSFVYAWAGERLGHIESKEDLYSPGLVLPIVLMLVLYLVPLIITYKRPKKNPV
jgi:uncharacterized membrane protein YdjX (TVP38/TMEM64 family)